MKLPRRAIDWRPWLASACRCRPGRHRRMRRRRRVGVVEPTGPGKGLTVPLLVPGFTANRDSSPVPPPRFRACCRATASRIRFSATLSTRARKLRRPCQLHFARSRQPCSSVSCQMSSGATLRMSAGLVRVSITTSTEAGLTAAIRRSHRTGSSVSSGLQSSSSVCILPQAKVVSHASTSPTRRASRRLPCAGDTHAKYSRNSSKLSAGNRWVRVLVRGREKRNLFCYA